MPDVTIVIPNWNGLKWLPGCFESLQNQSYKDFKVVVVDNGSTDGSLEWLEKNSPETHVIALGKNTGFAYAVNRGIEYTNNPYVVLLNNDTILEPDWLEILHSAISKSDDNVAGVCGKMLLMENTDVIENAGDQLSWQGAAEKRGRGASALEFNETSTIFSCCAGGAIYRRSFFDAVGTFDESFFAYLEDIDLGLRGNLLGYRFLYEPTAHMQHHSHGSSIPSATYVRLTTANRLKLFFKNIPGGLLCRKSLSILYGQWYFLVCNRRPVASLLGYWDVIKGLPQLIKKRKAIRSHSKLRIDQILTLLEPQMSLPGIFSALARKISRGDKSA